VPPDPKLLGAFYTPDRLVATVVDATVTREFVETRRGRPLRVLDPACGDGRFLAAAAERVRRHGGEVELHGVDVDPAAVALARSTVPGATLALGDALSRSWSTDRFDLVIGNPPFLSQLSEHTTRGGASRRGGGPYADVAAEFLALGAELAEPDGGRVALVLPQSMLASRDAAPIREQLDARARMFWSWWRPERLFDAQVHVVALAFEFGRRGDPGAWSEVVTRELGVPSLAAAVGTGTLGDRATLNSNFRDEYYGLVAAVGDHDEGPPLITSGLVDPGRTRWGDQPITFARRHFDRPRVDLGRLDARMTEWARRRLVPKVLVANQTRIVEAVCDPEGAWLPGVPVIGVYPRGVHWDDAVRTDHAAAADVAWEIAAVLTCGYASAWLWHRNAGTGLSAASVRVSPVVLAELPWPPGDLAAAVASLRAGDVRDCARHVDRAYGASEVTSWWETSLQRIETRRAR
jgi:SAM-dependent methyltransferase